MASTIFSSSFSTTTTTARVSTFNRTQSKFIRLRQPPAIVSCKPRNPGGFAVSISMQRRSCNSSITAVVMSARTKIPRVLNGKSVAKRIGDEITYDILRMKDAIGVKPTLAIILVGDRNHSPVHLANKYKACEAAGIDTDVVCLPEDSTEEEVLEYISQFNEKSSVHGIHIQLPLPRHMDKEKIVNAVRAEKDIDGFNTLNNWVLAIRDQEPLFLYPSLVPCTAKACIELLHRYEIRIKGKSIVVVGSGCCSDIVAPTAAFILQRQGATVTVVHPGTKNIAGIIRQADILISAAGKAYQVRGWWIKPGAIVIDAGNNIIKNRRSQHGYRFVGDVCYDEEACERAFAITPVPGGVDSMTIAMLLSNVILAAKRALKFK